jgi:hypothetical protein
MKPVNMIRIHLSVKQLIKCTLILSMSLVLLTSAMRAQCRISVKSPDTLAFRLKINETEINQWPCFATSFDFPQSGKVNVSVTFPSSPSNNFSQLLTLKKNYAYFYEVEKSKNALKLILKSESVLESEPSITVLQETTQNQEPLAAETPEDSLTSSTAAGCGQPATEVRFQQMLEQVKESYFESRKLETMKVFLATDCVSVEQLRFMMSRLSMEDNKIILLRSAQGHVSDMRNIKKVGDDFFLQKNKAQVDEITNSMLAAPVKSE